MKKLVLMFTAISLSTAVFAQKKNVSNAEAAVGQGELDEAKGLIDAAVADPTTSSDPKAWFVRGNVYYGLMTDPAKRAALEKGGTRLELEAARSYAKVVDLNPSYKKEEMSDRIEFASSVFVREASKAYDDKKYTEAADYYTTAIKLHDVEGGGRFSGNRRFDTTTAYARYSRGLAYYFAKDYDKALVDLNAVRTNPIVKDANIYLALSDIYDSKKNTTEMMNTISEGRKEFPENAALRNRELNAFISSGKQDELLRKLEEAVAKDPNSAELQYNLGNGYNQQAFPANAPKDAPKPANYTEILNKAEAAYLAAIKNDKLSRSDYQYNLGALYYNEAVELNNQMNNLGSTPEDSKKYDDLKSKRDALFVRALPYLDRAYQDLDSKSASLSGEDKTTYIGTLMALQSIYARQSKMDKVSEIKKKLDTARAK